ncbi:MAG TPA: EAL domain-containing protein [Polyangiaceae bacterium]|jgi:EAL domain-containing protein (putative c-di-GMP-specific phosphodiesterase class I)|nr:EAL domain-containing protein [Polyangiaceae bacterium]
MVVSPTQSGSMQVSEPDPGDSVAASGSGVMPVSSEELESDERADSGFKASVLVVDDDPDVLRGVCRLLRSQGYSVTSTGNGAEAARLVHGRSFDVIVSDIKMPGMDGIQLLREVRERDLHVPVVLVTGEPAVSTAVMALEYGAFHYLTKPVDTEALGRIVAKAVSMHRMARVKQQAAELLGHAGALGADRAGLEASFDRAMQSLWMAYHPIVDFRRKLVYGYEALLRSNEPSLPHPGAVLDAATRLGRLDALGRSIRDLAAAPMVDSSEILFVNLHVTDLVDPWLSEPEAPLSKIANRVVLEITERSSLDEVKDVRARVALLREMGFRIAVDDLGAGYAGLTSFTLLEPEIVKLDMSLVRDVHKNSTKQKVIRSMTSLSQDMGMTVVAEGVETVEERDTLIELDCDLLQGFLFARPSKPFAEVKW